MKRFLAFLLAFLLLFSLALPSFATGESTTIIHETDLSPVTSWLQDIFNSLGSLGDRLIELKDWLFKIADNIGKGFNYLYQEIRDAVNDILTSIGMKIDSFKDAVSRLFDMIKLKLIDVLNSIKSIFSRINSIFDEWKRFFIDKLEYYFVPTITFDSVLSNFRDTLSAKFSGVATIQVIFDSLKQFVTSDTPPTFSVTYKGSTVNIIDFAPYDAYRPFVHRLILFFSWFAFLRRLYHSVPNFIMSAGGYDGSSRSDRSPSSSSGGHFLASYSSAGQHYDVYSR